MAEEGSSSPTTIDNPVVSSPGHKGRNFTLGELPLQFRAGPACTLTGGDNSNAQAGSGGSPPPAGSPAAQRQAEPTLLGSVVVKKKRSGSVADMAKLLASFKTQQDTVATALAVGGGSSGGSNGGGVLNTRPPLGSLDVGGRAAGGRRQQSQTMGHREVVRQRTAPRAYREERGLSQTVARRRERLAARFVALGFPKDGCLQALKESDCCVNKTTQLLLFYFPKGDGVRTMVLGLAAVMTQAEDKLTAAMTRIRNTMQDGTIEERMASVRNHFDRCDQGCKEYLTPGEFHDLTSTLGVEMTDVELREAIIAVDADGNGQIEVDEYLMWWGDEELLQHYLKQHPGRAEILGLDVGCLDLSKISRNGGGAPTDRSTLFTSRTSRTSTGSLGVGPSPRAGITARSVADPSPRLNATMLPSSSANPTPRSVRSATPPPVTDPSPRLAGLSMPPPAAHPIPGTGAGAGTGRRSPRLTALPAVDHQSAGGTVPTSSDGTATRVASLAAGDRPSSVRGGARCYSADDLSPQAASSTTRTSLAPETPTKEQSPRLDSGSATPTMDSAAGSSDGSPRDASTTPGGVDAPTKAPPTPVTAEDAFDAKMVALHGARRQTFSIGDTEMLKRRGMDRQSQSVDQLLEMSTRHLDKHLSRRSHRRPRRVSRSVKSQLEGYDQDDNHSLKRWPARPGTSNGYDLGWAHQRHLENRGGAPHAPLNLPVEFAPTNLFRMAGGRPPSETNQYRTTRQGKAKMTLDDSCVAPLGGGGGGSGAASAGSLLPPAPVTDPGTFARPRPGTGSNPTGILAPGQKGQGTGVWTRSGGGFERKVVQGAEPGRVRRRSTWGEMLGKSPPPLVGPNEGKQSGSGRVTPGMDDVVEEGGENASSSALPPQDNTRRERGGPRRSRGAKMGSGPSATCCKMKCTSFGLQCFASFNKQHVHQET